MNPIEYRKVTTRDIPTLTEMRIKQLLEGGAIATLDIAPAMNEFYHKHLLDHSFVSWVALQQGKIIATSGMTFVEKPPYFSNPTGRIGLLSNMYTEVPYRRQGIATVLLSMVMAEARAHMCAVVLITASDAGTMLYTDFGFKSSGNFLQYFL